MSTLTDRSTFIDIANPIIKADTFLDYVPLLSLISNTINLVAKVALAIFQSILPSTYDSIKEYRLVVYLNNKSVLACLMLSIPFFNYYYACRYHAPADPAAQSTLNSQPSTSAPPNQSTQARSTFLTNNSTPAPQIEFEKAMQIQEQQANAQLAKDKQKLQDIEDDRLDLRNEVNQSIVEWQDPQNSRNDTLDQKLAQCQADVEALPLGSQERLRKEKLYETLLRLNNKRISTFDSMNQGAANTCDAALKANHI